MCGQVSRSGCVDSQQREKDVLSTCARRTEAGRKVETADRSSIVPRRWTPAECSHRYAGGVLKCWRGGRDDLALPSRRARARVSAAGDASLRPWPPREPHASTGCLGGGGFPQLLRPKARIRRTFLVYACWHQLKACPGAVLTAGREVCVAERKSHDMHEF